MPPAMDHYRTDMVIGTLDIDRWAVTFGTAGAHLAQTPYHSIKWLGVWVRAGASAPVALQ